MTRNATLAFLHFAWAATLTVYARRGGSGPRPHQQLRTTAACVLALRESAEALVTVSRGAQPPPRWPARLDGLHALSMLPVAIASRSLRRDALCSGAVAGAFAVFSRSGSSPAASGEYD